MDWERLRNGQLLKAAGGLDFDAFISIDKKIEYEQNLKILPLPIIILDAPSNTLPTLVAFAPFILDLLKSPLDRRPYIIESSGYVHRLLAPRS